VSNNISADFSFEAKAIIDAVLDFDQEKTAQLVRVHLDQGEDPLKILDQALIAAMDEVGRQFSAGVFFVPEMLMAAEAMRAGLEVLRPHLARSDIKAKGTIIIGTVKGDVHDIGKNMVAMMLECAGYSVIDLGVDVSKGRFLASAKKYQAHIVAISALLSTTLPEMEAVVADVRTKSGGSLKTLVGGAPVTASFADHIGADGYSPDAAGAVSMVRRLLLNPIEGFETNSRQD
jgi:5-methyltetrahydrofolate--homocysteine methyltransferase